MRDPRTRSVAEGVAGNETADELQKFDDSAVKSLEKFSNPFERLRRWYIRSTNRYARVTMGLLWGGVFAGLGFAFPPLWCLAPLGFSVAFPEMAKTFMAFTLLAVLGVGIAMAAGPGGLLIPAALGSVASMTSVAGYFATATLGITMAIGGALSLMALVKGVVTAAKAIYRFGVGVSRASKLADLSESEFEQVKQQGEALIAKRDPSAPSDSYGTVSTRTRTRRPVAPVVSGDTLRAAPGVGGTLLSDPTTPYIAPTARPRRTSADAALTGGGSYAGTSSALGGLTTLAAGSDVAPVQPYDHALPIPADEDYSSDDGKDASSSPTSTKPTDVKNATDVLSEGQTMEAFTFGGPGRGM